MRTLLQGLNWTVQTLTEAAISDVGIGVWGTLGAVAGSVLVGVYALVAVRQLCAEGGALHCGACSEECKDKANPDASGKYARVSMSGPASPRGDGKPTRRSVAAAKAIELTAAR